MKRSKFSDEQILAIVKEGEPGRKVADLCQPHGITEQTVLPLESQVRRHGASEMQRLKQDRGREPPLETDRRGADARHPGAQGGRRKKVVRPHRSARGGGEAPDARHESSGGPVA